MSKKQDIIQVFEGKDIGRIPVGFWFHYLSDFSKFNGGLNDPAILEENLAGAAKYKEEFDPDFVKIMTDGYFFIPTEGKTLDTVKIDESKKEAYKSQFVELVRRYRELYGDDIFLAVNFFSPIQIVSSALRTSLIDKVPHLQEGLKNEPEKVKAALIRIAEGLAEVIKAAVGPGLADGIFLSIGNLGNTVSEEDYKKYVTPADDIVVAAANGQSKHNILHICGYQGNRNDLNIFRDFDFEVINWAVHAENFGLAEGKKFFRNKTVIGGFGNTTNDVLYKGTYEEIEAETAKLISEVGRTGVIIGADCTVPSDIDIDRLLLVRKAANQ